MFRFLRSLEGPQGVVLTLGALALAGSFAIPAIAVTQPGPLEINDHVDTFAIEGNTTNPGAAGVVGQNAGDVNGEGVLGKNRARHGSGVEGDSTNATYGTGVYGTSIVGPGVYGLSVSAYPGVSGSSTYPNGTGVSGMSSGNAIYGVSTAASGVVGITRSNVVATGNKIFAGVLGIDSASERYINYGVAGTTANSSGAGVAGFGAGEASGVVAYSDTGTALTAASGGLVTRLSEYITNDVSFGVDTDVMGADSVGVLATSGGTGVAGGGTVGLAGTGQPSSTPGTMSTALQLSAFTGSTYELVASCYTSAYKPCPGLSSPQVMSVDPSGNMNLAGTVTATNVTQTAASNTSKGRRVTYDTAAASPTLEDAGESQLANGSAAVRLDPAFADSIDPGTPYLIFLTPLGDTPGLYVASRSSQGFVVREHGGARSNLAFDYRIVARPTGRREARLAAYVAPRPGPNRQLPKRPSRSPIARIAPTADTVAPAPR